jgi:HK97 family phage prohead protease
MTTTEIAGYAAVWYAEGADDQDWTYAPAAFSWWLKESCGTRLLYGHEDTLLLAHRGNGSLKLWEDDFGLAFHAVVQNQKMPNIHADLAAGRMGCSLGGARILASRRDFLNGCRGHRETVATWAIGTVATKATVAEISLTTSPGFPMARAWLADADFYDQTPLIQMQIDSWRATARAA